MPYSVIFTAGDAKTNNPAISALKDEFRLETCASAQQALSRLRNGSFDLAVFESDLPDMTGLTLLRILRETESGKRLPVIFLSARKTEESISEAFMLGADDYLVLPCDPRELAARIRAVIRRRHEVLGDAEGTLQIACIRIDPSQRRCLVNGKRVHLRPLEFELLKMLMRKAGRVLTRPYLLSAVWDITAAADTRTVDATVSRLRRALGRQAGKLIETVSKMGYCFNEPGPG